MLDNFDFSLLDSEDFKEDSVRELIIKPLLDEIGFEGKNALLNLSVKRSFKVQSDSIIGANKRIGVKDIVIPDYLLYINDKTHCVLDAKSPREKITPQTNNERQAFYYAINKDIKSPLYALCNGRTLIIYETSKQEILLEIDLKDDLKSKLSNLAQILTTPLESLRESFIKFGVKSNKKPDEWYLNKDLPKAISNPKKQEAKRHFGSMAYFTKQSWDIVAQNIKKFTDEGDIVLDSFGGSGVTAIEAMMNNRLGIHTDLNPLSIFMVKALTAKVNLGDLWDLSEEILAEFQNLRPKNEKEANALLKNAKYYPNAIDKEFGETATLKKQDEILWIPQDEILPKGSDVPSVLKLFSPLQLAELALLRKLILKHTSPSGTNEQRSIKRNMRYSLLLAFRNVVTMCNLTYHDTEARKGKGGNTSIYLAYRYRIPKKPTFLNVAEVFIGKVKRIIAGKKELETIPAFYNSYFQPLERVIKDFQGSMINQRTNLDKQNSSKKTNGEKIFQADATNLKEIESQSVDFIYTDPPYGAKIPYLDLSTMWNAWIDLPVDLATREKECIEKGSLGKSRQEYHQLMVNSLKEMFRVLKFNRWLTFVFQHQDPQLWQLLVEEAEKIGFEYVSSVRQSNGQTTFKKRQNPFTVLSGQLLMYFRKVATPQSRVKDDLGGDTFQLVLNNIEALIARDNGANLEEIYAELTIKGLELGFLHELGKMFEDLTPIINHNFDYDKESGKYHIKKGEKFKSHNIDLKTRAKYFVLSFLRGAERQNKKINFDDICLEVIPLLKNGVVPEFSLIRDILEEIAIPNNTGQWRLKTKEPTLFDNL